MVKNRINEFEFVDISDPLWRNKARSYLTRKQRSIERVISRTKTESQGERPRIPVLASKNDHENVAKQDRSQMYLMISNQQSPRTLLDPSDIISVAPFATLGKFERVAMDHCVSGLGYSTYNFRPHSFPFNALLRESLQDPACLHILIAKTAHHLDTIRQLSSPKVVDSAIIPSSKILWHKAQGMHLLKERIATISIKPDPMTVQAVLFLAELEDRFGFHDAAAVHFEGLCRMVDICGGFLAFDRYPALQTQLAWSEITHFPFFSAEGIAESDNVAETQISQGVFSSFLVSSEAASRSFESSSFVAKMLLVSRSDLDPTNYAESMRLNIHLAVLLYLYLYLIYDRPSNASIAEYSSKIAPMIQQYAAPGEDAIGVLLWILMVKQIDEQRYDSKAGISALADPKRTLTILEVLRCVRRTSWPSRVALINDLTDRVLHISNRSQ